MGKLIILISSVIFTSCATTISEDGKINKTVDEKSIINAVIYAVRKIQNQK